MPAVQSFDLNSGRIRNGIYLGPLKFFFDGPFIWRDKLRMLEFTFTRVSLAFGSLGPWSRTSTTVSGRRSKRLNRVRVRDKAK